MYIGSDLLYVLLEGGDVFFVLQVDFVTAVCHVLDLLLQHPVVLFLFVDVTLEK